MSAPRRLPPWLPLVLGAAVLVAHQLDLQPWTLDDAYISYRYAENWAAGLGPVFNAGERVEGYSNFLWVALLALGHGLGLPTDTLAKGLGALLHLGTLAMVAGAHRIAPEGPTGGVSAPTARLGALVFGTCGIATRWAMSGMETPLVTALLTAALLVQLRDRRGAGPAALTGLLLALAVMTRLDAGLALVLLLGQRLADLRRAGLAHGGGTLRGILALLLPFALVAGTWFLWRWSWYGWPLPNTFYVKVGATGDQVLRGLVYLLGFANVGWPLLLLTLAGLRPGWGGPLRPWAALFVLHLAYVVAVGGDVFWGYRFWAAWLPTMALVSARVLQAVPLAPLARRLFSGAVVGVNLFWLLLSVQINHQGVVSRDGAAVGRWLRDHAPPDALLATNIAGSIPYFSGLPTLDTLGLCDEAIAHREVETMGQGQPGHEKGEGGYVMRRAPDYVLFASSRGALWPKFLGDHELFERADFHLAYDLHLYELRPGFHLKIWVRSPEQGGKGLSATPLQVVRNKPARGEDLDLPADEAVGNE